MIVFDDNAPKELLDISVGHTPAPFDRDVSTGDTVVIGNKQYAVTAVGGEVNSTLRKMGHCTLCFDGSDTAEMPGHLVLRGEGLPEVKSGDRFEIRYSV